MAYHGRRYFFGFAGERALGTSGKVVVEIMIVISQIGITRLGHPCATVNSL